MADWELTFPKLFKSREAFRAYVRAKITGASEAFFVGISLTPEQKAAVTAYGEWCVVALGMGINLKSQSARKLNEWDSIMDKEHKAILDRRISWHLESIEKASDGHKT